MIKKIVFLGFFMILFSCIDDTQVNICFEDVNVSETIDFNLPANQQLLINGGSITTRIDGRTIYIIRNNSSNFVAFDLECPDRDCDELLQVNLPTITCTCHNISYNYLQGGNPIGEEGCGLLMYSVYTKGSNAIEIRN